MGVKSKLIANCLIASSIVLFGCDQKEVAIENEDIAEIEQIAEAEISEREENSNDKPLAEHLTYIESITKPAIHILKTKAKSNSKLGGTPLVADNFKWPIWQDKPLALLLQIDLSELPDSPLADHLPEKGLLSFYYDYEQRTWGFDPKDKGSWKVVYDKDINTLKPAKKPKDSQSYPQSFLQFSNIQSYPDTQNDLINKLELNGTQFDEYEELKYKPYKQQSLHQFFGYPSVIQNDAMDLSSQLTSNGIYLGISDGYRSEEAIALEAGAKDWILLLQFDSDETNGIMWADSGTLYFWVRKQDLEQQNFDNVWMKLQSY